jgi:hypothetical protein
MKKPTLSLLLVLFVVSISTSFAQIEKGTTLVSLSGAYSKVRSRFSNNQANYNFDLNGIKMLSPNFGLGLGVGLNGYDSFTYSDPNLPTAQIIPTKTNSYTIGPIARYYFMPTKSITPFLSSQVNAYFGQTDVNGTVYKSKGLKIGYDFSAGLACFLNKNVAIETGLHYKRTNAINLTAGIDYWIWSLGFQVYLPKK